MDFHTLDFSAADVHMIAAPWGSVALCKRCSVYFPGNYSSVKLVYFHFHLFAFIVLLNGKKGGKHIPPSRRCGTTPFLLCTAVL